ncbi:DUF3307 domain-containing protein [Brevundimonas nasdae]|uniref:DUF3307 domain-containing protein n=1 Tax=Brevundimonas nasdae TaxID=172043 RepID=A0ABX8TJS7_9CAUL|nr:DUF3307 domain-containing protein [Brevundimonas nasdae]QYC11465.1 DUF3307 domain-containing protein [Brevundimonas nasdae]QYC14253.1 DUF3307 domain-containing protein [Brevundimonas nasdae]
MLETLLALVVAHLLADFLFQSARMVANKRKPLWFAAHIAIVAGLTLALSGSLDPRVWLVIGVTHAAMDYIKIRWLGDGLRPFFIDQVFHLGVIAVVAVWRPDTVANGWIGDLDTEVQLFLYQGLAVIGGAVLSVRAGGVVVAKALETIAAPTVSRPDLQIRAETETLGLPGGGETIGALERALILLFLLIGQPEGIGLMLAAKSVLRFSDRNARAHTEYVIIGTMLSFGWALVSGVLTQAAVVHWG